MRNYENKKLRMLLLENEVTQADVADAIGVTRAAVCLWLKNEPISAKHEQLIRDAVDRIAAERTA